jgi:hypothetical protein
MARLRNNNAADGSYYSDDAKVYRRPLKIGATIQSNGFLVCTCTEDIHAQEIAKVLNWWHSQKAKGKTPK